MSHNLLKHGKIDKVKFASNNPAYVFKVGAKEGKTFNYSNIRAISREYVKEMRKTGKQFKVTVATKYDDINKYRNGKSTDINEDPQIFHPNDEEYTEEEYNSYSNSKVTEFEIYFRQTSGGGGIDQHNDCLYYALVDSGVKLPSVINRQPKLKKHFGLARDDLFPINKLGELAVLIKYQIQMFGEDERVYGGDYKKIIQIKLAKNHYTFKRPDNIVIRGLSVKPKALVMVYDENYNTYSENGYKENNIEFVKDGISNLKFSSKHIFVKFTKNNLKTFFTKEELTENENRSLKELYERFIMVADELKEKTDGYINLYTSGTNFKQLSQHLWSKTLKFKYNTKPVNAIEKKFVKQTGGLIFCKGEYEGPCFEYDINSSYQYTSCLSSVMFPIDEPVYGIFDQSKYIKDGKEYYPFGFYIAEVKKTGNKDTDTLFRFDGTNNYTHIDLNRAKELNLEINHTENGEANCAIYNELITGKELFDEYYKKMFALQSNETLSKSSKNVIKRLRNVLWGSLCETNKGYAHPENGVTKFDDINNDILFMHPSKNAGETYEIVYVPKNKYYLHEFARIGPFLTANARNYLSRQVEKHNTDNNILLSHTDSIFSKTPLDIETGDKLGQFKLSKQGEIKIRNVIDKKWL